MSCHYKHDSVDYTLSRPERRRAARKEYENIFEGPKRIAKAKRGPNRKMRRSGNAGDDL